VHDKILRVFFEVSIAQSLIPRLSQRDTGARNEPLSFFPLDPFAPYSTLFSVISTLSQPEFLKFVGGRDNSGFLSGKNCGVMFIPNHNKRQNEVFL